MFDVNALAITDLVKCRSVNQTIQNLRNSGRPLELTAHNYCNKSLIASSLYGMNIFRSKYSDRNISNEHQKFNQKYFQKHKIKLLASFSKLNEINNNPEKIGEWTLSVKLHFEIKPNPIIVPPLSEIQLYFP